MSSFIGVGVLLGSAVVVAVANSGGLPPWADYGVLGGMVIAFLTKQIVPGYLYRQQLERADAAELALRQMTDRFIAGNEAVIPTLRESTTAVLQATEEIRLIRSRRR